MSQDSLNIVAGSAFEIASSERATPSTPLPRVAYRWDVPPIDERAAKPFEVLEGVRSKIVTTPAGEQLLWGNRQATLMIELALKTINNRPYHIDGAVLPTELTEPVMGLIQRVQSQAQTKEPYLSDLAGKLESLSASAKGGVIGYVDADDTRTDAQVRTVEMHEIGVHLVQARLSRGTIKILPAVWTRSDPDYRQFGWSEIGRSYVREPKRLAGEAAAYVLSGEWEKMGYAGVDAQKGALGFADRYLREVARLYGVEAVREFRDIHPAMLSVVEKISHDISNDPSGRPEDKSRNIGGIGRRGDRDPAAHDRKTEYNGVDFPSGISLEAGALYGVETAGEFRNIRFENSAVEERKTHGNLHHSFRQTQRFESGNRGGFGDGVQGSLEPDERARQAGERERSDLGGRLREGWGGSGEEGARRTLQRTGEAEKSIPPDVRLGDLKQSPGDCPLNSENSASPTLFSQVGEVNENSAPEPADKDFLLPSPKNQQYETLITALQTIAEIEAGDPSQRKSWKEFALETGAIANAAITSVDGATSVRDMEALAALTEIAGIETHRQEGRLLSHKDQVEKAVGIAREAVSQAFDRTIESNSVEITTAREASSREQANSRATEQGVSW